MKCRVSEFINPWKEHVSVEFVVHVTVHVMFDIMYVFVELFFCFRFS